LSDERLASGSSARAGTVTVVARPIWRLRLVSALPRYLIYATCAAGLLASARFAIAPPRLHPHATLAPAAYPRDAAAEGYAALFARRYLTWDATQPQVSEQLLAPMTGPGIEAGAGLSLPATGDEHVLWAEVVQARRLRQGSHLYTVAAQTDTAGLLYLAVGVVRAADGALALDGYPAFVGAPTAGAAEGAEQTREVTDTALATVVERALRNYLAASAGELAADLSDGARVAVPQAGLALDSVQRLGWAQDMRSLLAVVHAHDARDTGYTLGYEVDVARVGRRWEVAAIETDPEE
jgi:Conjugative transposon protein TcpC